MLPKSSADLHEDVRVSELGDYGGLEMTSRDRPPPKYGQATEGSSNVSAPGRANLSSDA